MNKFFDIFVLTFFPVKIMEIVVNNFGAPIVIKLPVKANLKKLNMKFFFPIEKSDIKETRLLKPLTTLPSMLPVILSPECLLLLFLPAVEFHKDLLSLVLKNISVVVD